MDLISYLDSNISNSAGIIQFAKDGKYEEAMILSLNDERPSVEFIENYCSDPNYKQLIVEFVWNPDTDSERYVFTLVQDKNCAEQDRSIFVQTSLNIFYSKFNFKQLIQALDKMVVGAPLLLKSEIQRVRLGIFNHWFSTGPIEMWQKGEIFNENIVREKVSNRPDILQTKLNFQGLAFIFNFDGSESVPYHVLKTPTCFQDGDLWKVDVDLVLRTMKLLLISD